MIAVRVNETDTFADEDGANDEYFDFEDISGVMLTSLHQACQTMLTIGNLRHGSIFLWRLQQLM